VGEIEEDQQMAAALIGVIGVILGALITALLNFRAEANKRRGEARVAASLIAREIDVAGIRMGAYVTAKKWGTDKISTEQWRKNGSALAAELPGATLERVLNAYALIESWESKRTRCAGQPVAERDIEKLDQDQKSLSTFSADLKGAIPRPALARASGLVWALGLFSLLVVGVVFAIALFVPRAEMTDSSIAAALESKLHNETFVSCSHSADRWHCDVGYPQKGCRVAESLRNPTALLVVQRESVQKNKHCGGGPQSRSATVTYKVAEGPNGPVATLDPDEIAREKFRQAFLNVSDPSYFDRAVDEVLGDD
jgi:hypothetical protein